MTEHDPSRLPPDGPAQDPTFDPTTDPNARPTPSGEVTRYLGGTGTDEVELDLDKGIDPQFSDLDDYGYGDGREDDDPFTSTDTLLDDLTAEYDNDPAIHRSSPRSAAARDARRDAAKSTPAKESPRGIFDQIVSRTAKQTGLTNKQLGLVYGYGRPADDALSVSQAEYLEGVRKARKDPFDDWRRLLGGKVGTVELATDMVAAGQGDLAVSTILKFTPKGVPRLPHSAQFPVTLQLIERGESSVARKLMGRLEVEQQTAVAEKLVEIGGYEALQAEMGSLTSLDAAFADRLVAEGQIKLFGNNLAKFKQPSGETVQAVLDGIATSLAQPPEDLDESQRGALTALQRKMFKTVCMNITGVADLDDTRFLQQLAAADMGDIIVDAMITNKWNTTNPKPSDGLALHQHIDELADGRRLEAQVRAEAAQQGTPLRLEAAVARLKLEGFQKAAIMYGVIPNLDYKRFFNQYVDAGMGQLLTGRLRDIRKLYSR